MKFTKAERLARQAQKKAATIKLPPAPVEQSVVLPLPSVPVVEWHGCYNEGWRNFITPESFAHPAKAARGLLIKIFDHLFAIGALTKGSTIVDPFGGIGTTGIAGAWRGCRVICAELEPKFVELAKANVAMHARGLTEMRLPIPVVVQGDSRQLRVHVREAIDAVVSSPPFHDQFPQHDKSFTAPHDSTGFLRDGGSGYGSSAGNIAHLHEGGVEAIISSPQRPDDHATVDAIISSPPFGSGDSASAQSIVNRTDKSAMWIKENLSGRHGLSSTEGYGEAEGQMAEMKMTEGVDAVVTSPPFEGSLPQDHRTRDELKAGMAEKYNRTYTVNSLRPAEYGQTQGQIGAMQSDTFWSAARDIVRECHAILRPGGYAVWIVKAFVRDKAIVDFPGDWRKLCDYVGFETLTEVHAMLVKKHEYTDVFGEERVEKKERKSFFRRLAESKGSPEINFEVVYTMRKR